MSPTVFPTYLANGKCAGGPVFCFVPFFLDVVALKSFWHMAGVKPFSSCNFFKTIIIIIILKHSLIP